MISFIWSLVIGGLIGWVASLIVGRDIPGGVIGNIIAGFLGAWIGVSLLGNWGPLIGGFAIIPAILGAMLLAFIVSLIMRAMGKGRTREH